jgi:E3 ubiquitin-protein ligase RNF25
MLWELLYCAATTYLHDFALHITFSLVNDYMMNSQLRDELDLLRSMFTEDELQVDERADSSAVVVARLFSSADAVGNAGTVQVTLRMSAPKEYPIKRVSVTLPSSRGASDGDIRTLTMELKALAKAAMGETCMFQIIEAARERVNDLALHAECLICLDRIHEARESYVAPSCVHAFHIACLAAWVWRAIEERRASDDAKARQKTAQQAIAAAASVCDEAEKIATALAGKQTAAEARVALAAEYLSLCEADEQAAAEAAASSYRPTPAAAASSGKGSKQQPQAQPAPTPPAYAYAYRTLSDGTPVVGQLPPPAVARASLREAQAAAKEARAEAAAAAPRLRRAREALEEAQRTHGAVAAGGAAASLTAAVAGLVVPCPYCRAPLPYDGQLRTAYEPYAAAHAEQLAALFAPEAPAPTAAPSAAPATAAIDPASSSKDFLATLDADTQAYVVACQTKFAEVHRRQSAQASSMGDAVSAEVRPTASASPSDAEFWALGSERNGASPPSAVAAQQTGSAGRPNSSVAATKVTDRPRSHKRGVR